MSEPYEYDNTPHDFLPGCAVAPDGHPRDAPDPWGCHPTWAEHFEGGGIPPQPVYKKTTERPDYLAILGAYQAGQGRCCHQCGAPIELPVMFGSDA